MDEFEEDLEDNADEYEEDSEEGADEFEEPYEDSEDFEDIEDTEDAGDIFADIPDFAPELETQPERINDIEAFTELLEETGLFAANIGKQPLEMEFTDRRKETYMLSFENNSTLKKATDLEVSLCRRFTDELCAKDSILALHLKGYACYGGNRLYPCDWPASRDCIMRLFDKTGDPQYANTLGYIYYYGRCTNGVPEYEKAYEMFVISAANGLHEGM